MRRLSATPPAKRPAAAEADVLALTPSGVQILRAGVLCEPHVVVRVLGVFRYMADPALRRVLPEHVARHLDRDVFDLLVTDGHMKLKCMLSPARNALVWRQRVAAQSILRVRAFDIVHDGALDADTAPRAFCVLRDLDVLSPEERPPRARRRVSLGGRPRSSVAPPTAEDDARLAFHSRVHAREHCALPLAGGRLYYLSLLSDDCPLDWEPASASGLAHCSVSARYVEPWAEWSRRRQFCVDVFREGERVLHSLRDAVRWASAAPRGRGRGRAPAPRLTGVVRYKSKLTHLGDPAVASAFPFMFHVVLSDREQAIEVAFFGSMAARYVLVVEEGDVVQLEGYDAALDADQSRRLFVLPHLSDGRLWHVPEKYWKLLEMTRILPARASNDASPTADDLAEHSEPGALGLWVQPTVVTVRALEAWRTRRQRTRREERSFFDVVGVVTFAGRVERRRAATVSAFRWIKLVDRSVEAEAVVRVDVSTQPPAAVAALKAGDVVLLTRLRWSSGEGLDASVATTSAFSRVLLNDDLAPFAGVAECALARSWAETLLVQHRVAYAAENESRLEGPVVSALEPTAPLPSSVAALVSGLRADPLRLRDIARAADAVEALECKWLVVRGSLRDLQRRPVGLSSDAVVVVVGDPAANVERSFRARPHALFRSSPVPPSLRDATASEALPFLKLLAPSILERLAAETDASTGGSALSADAIARHLQTRSREDYGFAVSASRAASGALTLTVHAIVPLE
ncbi:hypothetical protein P43SY_008017 [Pythium insidiosum]|uniref:Uncharacterized protein n=1 Tax=Pythium insidiosum TaxID=114742 RepID=A0AAD5Q9Q2_PYTIN|nr:hypothetical protein P43SY_008017 [Pythium insidiosum]